jgi:Spherulation-specific family 4
MSMTPDPPDDWQKVKQRVLQGDAERKVRPRIIRPVTIVVIVAVLVLGAAAGLTAKLMSGSAAPGSSRCQAAFVPAFFYGTDIWTRAAHSKPAPKVMILDISGMGAGTAPEPHFASVVRQAKAAGVTILGYSSTAFGLRPLSQIEADVRNYKAWYGVTDIFLDEVRGVSSQLPYYRTLYGYIHHHSHGSSVWLNPGNYPDEGYMSVGNVVMAFEGPYTSYTGLHVPSWAYRYRPSRFANTIYATAGSQVHNAISLSRNRNAGYVYVTNRSGPNPYDGLPNYWETENSAITAGCSSSAALSSSQVTRLAP